MALRIDQDEPERLLPAIGDNSQAAKLSELLLDRFPKLSKDAQALLDRIGLLPPEIRDDKTHSPYADLAKEISAFVKRCEAYRVNEKEPWLSGVRQVDQFFKSVSDPLEAALEDLGTKIGEYLTAKKEAEEARLRALKLKADNELRAKAEEARKREAEATKAVKAAAAKVSKTAGVSAAAAKRRILAALPAPVARKIEAAGAAAHDVTTAERRVDHIAQRQAGPAAAMARTRSTQAVSTLQEEWTFTITDIRKIPLEELRPYLNTEAIEKAITGFMKTGRRQLKGVKFFKKPRAQIR